MIDWTPDPIAFSLGPLTVYWYGVMYALGLAATFVVIEREARRRGLDAGLLVNGMIIVAVAALIGGRLYHVIDQWDRYKDDLPRSSCRPTAAWASTAGSSPASSWPTSTCAGNASPS